MKKKLFFLALVWMFALAAVLGALYVRKHYSLRGKLFEVSFRVSSPNGPVEVTELMRFHARQVSFADVREQALEELEDRGIIVAPERVEILSIQQP